MATSGKSSPGSYAVPGLPYYIDDISYWIPNIMKTRDMVAEMQGVPFDGSVVAAARRQEAQFANNLPANAHLDDGTYFFGMDKDKPGEKGKPDDKKKPGTTPVKIGVTPGTTTGPSTRLAAEIVNASGMPEAGGRVSAILSGRGFEVVGVSTSSTIVKNTVVTSYSDHPSVVSKLTGLPMKYVLQVSIDSSRRVPVRVLIGQDYAAR